MSVKFSIVMPTFDRPEYIVEAIQAICLQNYDNWELIIKDGGTKPIFDLLPEDNRIIYIYGKDRGITHALNQGLALATGRIRVWANDDDVMNIGTLRFVAENIGSAQWFYGQILATRDKIFGNTTEVAGHVIGEPWDYQKHLRQYNLVPQPVSFWTEKAQEIIGLFDESQDLVSDYDYWIRLGKVFKPKFIPKILAYYRIHSNQITSKIFEEQSRQAEETRRKHIEMAN